MSVNPATLSEINAIIDCAASAGRYTLFEHEVYAILSRIGLHPPNHKLITSPSEITPDLLSTFSADRIVIKAMSVDLTHKQKHGGVKIVLKDLEFLRYSCSQMLRELDNLNMAGILLVEHVAYDKDLGNEILLGFRESAAFGPVISFSKGGSDAEHFAEHFSEPNIILAPVDNAWAHALLSSTQIHYKYLAEGKDGYIDKISNATVSLSDIACSFSSFYQSESQYVVSEFEINPIVFDPYGKMIPLDGYAAFRRKPSTSPNAPVANLPSLDPFFQPKGIAVVGVSAKDSDKPGNIIAENLTSIGRTDVFCINPSGGEVSIGDRELPLHQSLDSLPQPVDLVIIAVPAKAVSTVVRQCASINAKSVLITAGGFSETTGNADVDAELLEIARESDMRLIGPNCLGIIHRPANPTHGINTFFIPRSKFSIARHDRSNVVLISQSGAAGIVEINNLRNALSPKTVVSYGNQLDVDPCDLIRYFGDDPDVEVIGCYIEGFKPAAGREFFKIAAGINKPIVVYKAGRTEMGQQATASHTASIAGEYSVARAALKQAGVVVADTMLDHMGYIKTFALLSSINVTGRRVAVVTNAGYEKTNAADHVGDLIVPDIEDHITKRLAAALPSFVNVEPLLDLTPMVTDEQFAESIDALLSSKNIDCICISIVPQAQLIHTTDDEMATYQQNVAARIVEIMALHKKPVVVSFTVETGSDSNYNAFSRVLEAGGIPTFLSAERAMMFLNAVIRYHLMRQEHDLSERLK